VGRSQKKGKKNKIEQENEDLVAVPGQNSTPYEPDLYVTQVTEGTAGGWKEGYHFRARDFEYTLRESHHMMNRERTLQGEKKKKKSRKGKFKNGLINKKRKGTSGTGKSEVHTIRMAHLSFIRKEKGRTSGKPVMCCLYSKGTIFPQPMEKSAKRNHEKPSEKTQWQALHKRGLGGKEVMHQTEKTVYHQIGRH